MFYLLVREVDPILTVTMMRLSWFIWLITTVLMILYVWAGFVASRTEMVGVKLEPGYSTQVRIFRFAEDRLRMQLVFKGEHTRRPELGTWSTRSDWRESGVLKFDNSGSAIRIVASVPDLAPVTYEAMPTSGYGALRVIRDLTASLSVSPGVWQWPPVRNELRLHRGTNVVNIEVVAVERPLVGEGVELWVRPALGFETAMPNVMWLWPWFLWPILIFIQVLWAVALGRRRQDEAPESLGG